MYCPMPDKDDIECKEGTTDDGRGSISSPPTVSVTVSPPSVTVSPGSCPPDDTNGKSSFNVTVTTEFRFQYPAH
jgi:hypothetical protein